MSKQVCSICGRPQHFGTCEQVAKVPKKLSRQTAADQIELGRLHERAIERGERLEKIVTLIQKRLDDVRYYHLEVQGADATLLVKVLKLAKGA